MYLTLAIFPSTFAHDANLGLVFITFDGMDYFKMQL